MVSTELNLLDAAFLNIEREQDPWSIHVELQLEGSIDETRLAAAVDHAVQQHPMARARLRPFTAGTRRYHWEIDDEISVEPLHVVDAVDDDALESHRSAFLSEAVALDESPGFRLLLVHHREGDRLLINLSHTLADGLSAMRILNSIVRHYAGAEDPLPAVDPLAVRDLGALSSARDLGERLKRLKLFLEYLRVSATPPTRVTGLTPRTSPSEGYGALTLELDSAESAYVSSRREKPATVNDLLMAAWIHTIRRWNEKEGGRVGKVSVMMPVNLRPRDWWFEVVGNYSSYVNVILAPDQQEDPDEACRAVSEQTLRYKEAGAAGTLIDVLTVPKHLPAILKARLREIVPTIGRSHVQTSWLSNLGRLADAPVMGDAGRVKAIYFSPPAPMPMGVSLGAASLEDRMMLTLRYRHALFDSDGAARFAALFKAILLNEDQAGL